MIGKLNNLPLTTQPAIEQMPRGTGLTLDLEDGRIIQLSFDTIESDSNGWLRFALRDSDQKLVATQWYSLPKESIESVDQYLTALSAD